MTSSEPLPPLGDESWEDMAARVANEVTDITNLTYATSLARAMQAYVHVGFSHDQAFQMVLVEHRARMEVLASNVVLNAADDPDA